MPRHEPHILHIFVDTFPDRIGIGPPWLGSIEWFDQLHGTSPADRWAENDALTEAIRGLQKELHELQDLQREDGDRLLTADELEKFSKGVLWIKKPTLSTMCSNIARRIESTSDRQKDVQELLGVGKGSPQTIVKILRDAAKKELAEALTSKDAPEWMKLSALFYAIQANDITSIQKLIRKGVNLDVGGPGGTTAVGLAIEIANAEVLELLAKAGAKLDIPCAWAPRIWNPDDQNSGACFTPMYFAVGCGWAQGVEILLKHGVGALTGSLQNSALGDLERYELTLMSEQEVYVFIG
jgi:hypothetical protein